MTTTRDPLAVLRKHRDHHEAMAVSDAYSAQEAPRLREAIAQVEALVKSARMASATLGHAYHTTLTGQLAEYAHSDYQKLDAALAHFTPGQDSEGGGHG